MNDSLSDVETRQRVSLLDSNGAVRQSIIRPAKSFTELCEELDTHPALKSVLKRLDYFTTETRDRIDEELYTTATEVANNYLASVAVLFVKGDNSLHAIFAHKNRHRDELLPIDGRSIAAHVAETQQPFAAPDVSQVPFYKPFPGMRSAISVPLMTVDGELLGVFLLESTELNEYRQDQIPKLATVAADLVPLLLMLRALDRDDDRWCPWRSFDLAAQLRTLCHEVRRALDPNGIQCTIWSSNREEEFLFVYTTTGHACEYRNQKRLPFNSFNGALSNSPPGTYGYALPGKPTMFIVPSEDGVQESEGPSPFLDDWKGSFLKWRKSVGVPLYIRIPGRAVAEDQGTLVVSCFDEEGEAALPSRDELIQIGDEIADFISGHLALSAELAVTYFDHALRTSRRPKDAFEAIVLKFTEFFCLEAIAVDGYVECGDPATNITQGGFGTALEWVRSPSARNPFKVFRPDVFNKAGRSIGTIHLARTRPFTVSEQELATRLAAMCTDRFEKWQAEQEAARRAMLYGEPAVP